MVFYSCGNLRGFRRVTHFEVGEGVVTYQNALFQRDEPHLVKHMRMDSDVQDVFERHQMIGDSSTTGSKKRKTGSDRRAASKRAPNNQALDAELLERRGVGSASPGSSWHSGGQAATKEDLLRQIMLLTEQFLNHPGTLDANDATFNSLFQTVYAQGMQHQQGRILGQVPYPVATGVVGNPSMAPFAQLPHPQVALERNLLPAGYPVPNTTNALLDSLLRNRETLPPAQFRPPLRRPDPTTSLLVGAGNQQPLPPHHQSQRYSSTNPTVYIAQRGAEAKESYQEEEEISRSESNNRNRREYVTADELLLRVMQSRDR